MAKSAVSLEKIKDFLSSQINDEQNWAVNSAVGLFAGSIFLMRNFGDLMTV